MASKKPYWMMEPGSPEYKAAMLEDLGYDPMSDPGYNALYSNINAAGGMDLANSREAIQQMLISFGVVPEGFNDSLGSVDDRVRELIAKNNAAGLSTNAQMTEAFTDDKKAFNSLLGSKGLRRSGAKGFGLRKRKKGFDRAKSQALSKMLQSMKGIYNQYAANQMARMNALQQGEGKYRENWQTPMDPGWGSDAGEGWWNPWEGDSSGNNPGGGEGWGRNDGGRTPPKERPRY